MRPVTLSVPPRLLQEIDKLVERGLYTSRGDAIRHGARLLLQRYKWAIHICEDEEEKHGGQKWTITRKRSDS